MDFILLITVILTAVVLVVGAYVVAKLVGPRSYNPVKGQPFECGIPTRGTSWIPVQTSGGTESHYYRLSWTYRTGQFARSPSGTGRQNSAAA